MTFSVASAQLTPLAEAIIDVDAIARNVRTLAAFRPDAAIMAVVKADGFGHGWVGRQDCKTGKQIVCLLDDSCVLPAPGRITDAPLVERADRNAGFEQVLTNWGK